MFDLRPYNTFGFAVSAKRGVIVRGTDDLRYLPPDERYIILGRGSDVLLTEDFEGTALIDDIQGFSVEEDSEGFTVRAGSGVVLDELISELIARGITGLENLSYIPGTVGAAPVQNVGAYGLEIASFIKSVEAFDLKSRASKRLSREECGFGYRTSAFKEGSLRGMFITAVNFRINFGVPPLLIYPGLAGGSFDNAGAIRNKVIELRKRKLPDPRVTGNAGSFFKNPQVSIARADELKRLYPEMPVYPGSEAGLRKLAAGWLIDKVGCRGVTHGNAGTWEHQALVLVNRGGATPGEIIDLARHIIGKVRDKFHVELEPEVRIYDRNGETQWAQIPKS